MKQLLSLSYAFLTDGASVEEKRDFDFRLNVDPDRAHLRRAPTSPDAVMALMQMGR